jgi:membrane-associated protein
MHAFVASPPLLHGATQWFSPDVLVGQFGVCLFWLGIIMLFVECGRLWPALAVSARRHPAADQRIKIVPGPRWSDVIDCPPSSGMSSDLRSAPGLARGSIDATAGS